MAQVVKVLIVTDGGGGFKHSIKVGNEFRNAFHLAEFVDVLQSTVWNGFTLQITKAHRENRVEADIGADLVNFKFDTHDLSAYDEILLFPILRDNDSISVPFGQPSRSSNATDEEVKAIAEFMDAGGGVFATGDHEDLGAGLCSRLPRVRNMRRWYWNEKGPNGEPVAPQGDYADRFDTLRAGHDYNPANPNANYQFDDQSDNIAQQIAPKIFETKGSRYLRQKWPHPVLCSPEGMIRYLPDHAHEGRCEVPANMGLNVTVADYNQQEYPPLPDGNPLEPVVVANATVIGGHATLGKNGVVNAATFGVIGAYDGHRTSRAGRRLGRVVVDATWHHFFNINLTGDLNSPTLAKRQGFYAPLLPGQQDHYKMIKHYFRNIVYWLIPAHRRARLLHHLLTTMVRDAQFYELNPVSKIRYFGEVDLSHIITLGKLADAYFRQAHGACFTLQILPIILYEIDPLRRFWERFEPRVNPWIPERLKNPVPANIDEQFFVNAMLGSTVLAALQAKNDLGITDDVEWNKDFNEKSFDLFEKHLPDMLSIGATHFGREIQRDLKETEEFVSTLKNFTVKQ